MEKRYLLKDTSRLLEFHLSLSEYGYDFSLLNKDEEVIDGGILENTELTEKEILKEIEGFLSHIQPKVILNEDNLKDISETNIKYMVIEYLKENDIDITKLSEKDIKEMVEDVEEWTNNTEEDPGLLIWIDEYLAGKVEDIRTTNYYQKEKEIMEEYKIEFAYYLGRKDVEYIKNYDIPEFVKYIEGLVDSFMNSNEKDYQIFLDKEIDKQEEQEDLEE